jgi:RHS repeat-associated protein
MTKNSDLALLGLRYYMPSIGRFTTVDPRARAVAVSSEPQAAGQYVYADATPTLYVDGRGLQAHGPGGRCQYWSCYRFPVVPYDEWEEFCRQRREEHNEMSRATLDDCLHSCRPGPGSNALDYCEADCGRYRSDWARAVCLKICIAAVSICEGRCYSVYFAELNFDTHLYLQCCSEWGGEDAPMPPCYGFVPIWTIPFPLPDWLLRLPNRQIKRPMPQQHWDAREP